MLKNLIFVFLALGPAIDLWSCFSTTQIKAETTLLEDSSQLQSAADRVVESISEESILENSLDVSKLADDILDSIT